MKRRLIKSVNLSMLLFLCAITSLSFSACTSEPQAEVELKAGVAKAVITTDEPMVMVNGRISEGKFRDIHARALVLNDEASRFIIITYDLNCLDVATPILRQRVRDELGIDPSRLILLATHNHNAPIQIVPDNFEYGKWLANRLFDLIQEAIADERGPVKLLFDRAMDISSEALGTPRPTMKFSC